MVKPLTVEEAVCALLATLDVVRAERDEARLRAEGFPTPAAMRQLLAALDAARAERDKALKAKLDTLEAYERVIEQRDQARAELAQARKEKKEVVDDLFEAERCRDFLRSELAKRTAELKAEQGRYHEEREDTDREMNRADKAEAERDAARAELLLADNTIDSMTRALDHSLTPEEVAQVREILDCVGCHPDNPCGKSCKRGSEFIDEALAILDRVKP